MTCRLKRGDDASDMLTQITSEMKSIQQYKGVDNSAMILFSICVSYVVTPTKTMATDKRTTVSSVQDTQYQTKVVAEGYLLQSTPL